MAQTAPILWIHHRTRRTGGGRRLTSEDGVLPVGDNVVVVVVSDAAVVCLGKPKIVANDVSASTSASED